MTVKRFGIAVGLVVCGLCFSAPPARASLLTHSEVHVSNLQVTPIGGSLSWIYSPGLNIAAGGVFDEPSGWNKDYDDDPGATGQATANATGAYGSASAFASSSQNKIDVVTDINNPTSSSISMSNYGYGEIYNLFQLDGNDPLQVTFSLDWSAQLSRQSSEPTHSLDYAIQILVSDGSNDFSSETYNILSKQGTQLDDSGKLTLTFMAQPNTLYSMDVPARLDLGQYVPEPSSISLLFMGMGLLARKLGLFKRKGAGIRAGLNSVNTDR